MAHPALVEEQQLMKELEKRNRLHWIIIISMANAGILGLFLTRVFSWVFSVELQDNLILFIFMIASMALFLGGLMFFLPVQVLYFERKARRNKPLMKMSGGDLVGLPFGAYNPEAEVPKWISIPVKLLLWLLVGIIALMLIGAALSFVLMLFLPEQA